MADGPELLPPPGAVELREDAPLKRGGGGAAGGGEGGAGGCCRAGPRLLLAGFGALSAAITVALLTQIYYGDYEVVPHGSVSSSAGECSRAGTDALKAGGRALDAACAAALCLAVLAPHDTSLDASGSMLYWEYRSSRTRPPTLYEWGPQDENVTAQAGRGTAEDDGGPQLVAALAALHARLGALPWPRLLQPAIDLARGGYTVSAGLALAAGGRPLPEGGRPLRAGERAYAPRLAAYLESLQLNSSAEVAAALGGARVLRRGEARSAAVGGRRVWAGGPAAPRVLRALEVAFREPGDPAARVLEALQREDDAWPPSGTATGMAVVDRLDTYLALVTGLPQAFGAGGEGGEGGAGGEGALDLAPALLLDRGVCGARYVVGGESGAALAQGAALLLAGAPPAAVERARAERRGGRWGAPGGGGRGAALNLVQQLGDRLQSHADSRGGGLASRF